jgi:outer membrane cobalamin receptor
MLMLLFANDSTSVDTVETYEIPEIVRFQNGIFAVGEIIPRYYEQSITDVLANLPVMTLSYGFTGVKGVGFRGAKPYYTRIYLNGRQQRDDFTGYFNLAQLLLNAVERVAYGRSIVGSELSSLNFESKINRYDRPYSYARFMFGSFKSNIYSVDLTRAITNDLGLYVSGEYHKTAGFREHADANRLSVYAHLYYNHFFPARLDFFYNDHDYGFPGSINQPIEGRQKDRFLDISTTVAFQHSVMNFFYEARNMEYADSQNVINVDNRIKQFGADLAYHHDPLGFAVDYGVASYFLEVDGSVTSYIDVPLDLWARLSKEFHRFSLQVSGYFGKANDHENFYCPKLEVSYEFYESHSFCLSIGRDARAPSDIEINAVFDTLNPYFFADGNRDLVSEYCWIREVGVRGNQYAIGYYRFDYDNFITVDGTPGNHYEFVNIDSWLITGCDAYFDLPLRFHNTDSSRTVSVVLGCSGNIIFEGDSVPYVPRYHGGGHLSIIRETDRFSIGVVVRGELCGTRRDISGQDMSGFGVMSLAGLVKFMGLSCVARVNNIFDEEYAHVPYYPMPPRNFDVSVKWEFWD